MEAAEDDVQSREVPVAIVTPSTVHVQVCAELEPEQVMA
jgi:hypothetical protein